jgi:predicted RecB family nuclease
MFFATDITNYLACQHIATLNREHQEGKIRKNVYADPGAELLRKLGLEHEPKHLSELKARGLKVVEISTDVLWTEAASATREAMVYGTDVIYQATFVQGAWGGRGDFLRRVEISSELGAWSYEVVETKLAKSTKARALIQLCFYSELVAAIQGKVPERMHVVLGRGVQQEEFSVGRYLAYFRKVKREFESSLTAPPVTYPEPVEHCGVCDWFSVCDERWHQDDHLSLVAGITRNQRKALVEREICSVETLARQSLPVVPKLDRIAPAPLLRIREQARVQVRGRDEERPVYELVQPVTDRKGSTERRGDAEPQRGFGALPLPSRGDVFLDFEGDPFAFDQGLEYLIGTVTIEDGQPKYNTLWAFDPAQEKRARLWSS